MARAEPAWAAIARAMYDEGGLWTDQDMERYVTNQLGVGGFEAGTVISKLKDWGLIEDKTKINEGFSEVEAPNYTLSENGFRVIHERQQTKQENRVNRLLIVFTAGLFFSAFVQAQVAWVGLDPSNRAIFVGPLIAIFAVTLWLLWRFDIP